MSSTVIGDPGVFAIEYSGNKTVLLPDRMLTDCHLILAGKRFGELGVIFIASVWQELNLLLKYTWPLDEVPSVPESPEALGALWHTDLPWGVQDFFHTAGFDIYHAICFQQDDNMVIYWCVRPACYEYADDEVLFPRGVHVEVVPVATVKRVADQFREHVEAEVAEILRVDELVYGPRDQRE